MGSSCNEKHFDFRAAMNCHYYYYYCCLCVRLYLSNAFLICSYVSSGYVEILTCVLWLFSFWYFQILSFKRLWISSPSQAKFHKFFNFLYARLNWIIEWMADTWTEIVKTENWTMNILMDQETISCNILQIEPRLHLYSNWQTLSLLLLSSVCNFLSIYEPLSLLFNCSLFLVILVWCF